MSNPYEPPREVSSPKEPQTFDDDAEIVRLRQRLVACGIAIGLVFGATGIVQLGVVALGSSVDAFAVRTQLVSGAVAIFLMTVGGIALFGRPAAMYVALPISTLWLAWLTIYLPIDLAKKDIIDPETTLLIYAVLAIPGVVTAPLSIVGIVTDRTMSRRREELACRAVKAPAAG